MPTLKAGLKEPFFGSPLIKADLAGHQKQIALGPHDRQKHPGCVKIAGEPLGIQNLEVGVLAK